MTKVKHYTISLPAHVTAKLQAESEESKIPKSTLIAQHLEDYYVTAAAKYEEQMQKLKSDHAAMIQELTKDYEAKVQEREATIQELKVQQKELNRQHTAEVQKIRGEIQQVKAAATAEIQQAQKEAAEKSASQDLVIKGLHNEVELAKTEAKNLSEKIISEADAIRKLEDDKDFFKKQLELVTLRLPPARVSFWSRVFKGRKPKEERERHTPS